jgi:hypothetical protein
MDEKTLIGKIEILGQIKPRKSWVILTKKRILGEERTLPGLFLDSLRVFQGLFFQYRLALASLILILVLGGTFAFAQKSLPGEPLFVIKKITEKTRAVFVAENEKPKVQLELANKRLEDLAKIAQKNDVKKLAPAIDEFQANVSEAAKNLAKTKKVDKEIIAKTQELEKNKEKIEKTLGVNIGDKETEESLNDFYKTQAEYLINDFKNRTLTDEGKIALEKAEKEFDSGNYLEALTILIMNQK